MTNSSDSMDTRAAGDLSLVAARFTERTLNAWESCHRDDPDIFTLLGLLLARLHRGCEEPVWSSSVQVNQADLQPSISELCKSFPNCLAAIMHFTSELTIPMGFTNADGSQKGATISKEARTLETDKLECSSTSILRCALVQGHISACMHGMSLYGGSRTETMSWRCYMHVIDLLALCARYGSGYHTTR